MKRRNLLLLSLLVAACGGPPGAGDWGKDEKKEEYVFPVAVAAPTRGEVEDWVETQATLESDRRADIHAEVDGEIVERARDLGDRVGQSPDGRDPRLLARIDDRDLRLALRDAEIKLKEKRGRIQELELERNRASRELEQARVTLEEAEAALARTTSGIRDGTISMEEHEKATFARNLAGSKVRGAQAALEKAEVALTLGSVAVEEAEVAVERATVALERATLRAPFDGVVTVCEAREGERVRVGDLLYRVEDPTALVVYGDIPVRQAYRVRAGNPVHVVSNAAPESTTGRVILVAPTVDRDSGTVRCKVQVEPGPGFKPGLFVTLRIVVETRDGALVVPKRAVLHDDEEGAYLFVVEEGKAARRLVETGFEGVGVVEIVSGVDEGAQVVVEGQDTVTGGAKVEIRAG